MYTGYKPVSVHATDEAVSPAWFTSSHEATTCIAGAASSRKGLYIYSYIYMGVCIYIQAYVYIYTVLAAA